MLIFISLLFPLLIQALSSPTNNYLDDSLYQQQIQSVNVEYPITPDDLGDITITNTITNFHLVVEQKQDFTQNYQAIAEFFNSIRSGDTDKVIKYLEQGMDPNIREILNNTSGTTALICALSHRRVIITKILLNFNANPNLTTHKYNISNITPLMIAVQQGPEEVVEDLINSGAYIDEVTEGIISGQTALMVAAHTQRESTVNLLLSHGADINKITTSGSIFNINALMIAAQKGNIPILKNLLSTSSIKLNSVDSEGKSALIYGYISGNIDTIKLLSEAGVTTDLSPEQIRAFVKKYL